MFSRAPKQAGYTKDGQFVHGVSQELQVEKVTEVWGSVAGAGSDFFHNYRKHRTVEMDRLKKMDEDHEAEQERIAHEAEREQLREADELRARKRREKRKRKQLGRQTSKKKASSDEMAPELSQPKPCESGGTQELDNDAAAETREAKSAKAVVSSSNPITVGPGEVCATKPMYIPRPK